MTDPAEVATLRCHWIRLTDQPADVDPWVLIPGCEEAAANPFGRCDCDTLARRLALQVEQRRELEAALGEWKRRCRKWSRAGALAWAALTGKPVPGNVWPEDVAAAAHRATASPSTASTGGP